MVDHHDHTHLIGQTPVQRCIRHKERNVLDHLPERDRPPVKRRLRRAWADTDHDSALDALRVLAGELDRSHPGAAASRRRSRSPASGSAGSSSRRSSPPTPASR